MTIGVFHLSDPRLIILSLDAMVTEDLESLKNEPCFRRLMTGGSRINRIRTVYPSLTYPSHVSILTGVRPGRHGIVNNEPSVPGNLKCDWFWFHQPVRSGDLHDAAKEAGLTTASVFWPASGAHPSVDFLVAEYWAQGKGDTLKAAYTRAGTSDELFDYAVFPYLESFSSWESPVTDEAKIRCACDIIRRYKPNLLTLHLGQIDYYRHRYGVFNDMVTKGVMQSERYLKMLFDACLDAGVFDNTNFIVLSDHGQINYTRRMNINLLLRREGLIGTDEDGGLSSWDAWIKTANFSGQVYLRDPADKKLHDRVYRLLRRHCEAGDMGISRVYKAEEARFEEGLYGDFSFVIESDDTTLFLSDWREPMFLPAEPISGCQRASHGHHPSKGPQPVFLAIGPDIRPGVVIENGDLTDEAPTFAKLLGVSLPGTDGKPFERIIL